jgi:uncharacterized protein involved in exopolysaccharide biosynthesis
MQTYKKIDWEHYLEIFFRFKWVFFIPCFASVIIATFSSFFMDKVYQSQSIILVKEEKLINPLIKGLAVSTAVRVRMRTLREEILSWPRLMELAEKLGLDKRTKNRIGYERLIESLRKRIRVSLAGNNLIRIAFQDKNPKMAQKVTTTITDIIIEKSLQSQSEDADTAINFIKEQLNTYKKKLETSEDRLRRFKELYLLEMPVASKINQQLSDLETQLTNLLVDCTEEHPKVKELRRRIKALREKRIEEIRKAAKTFFPDMEPNKYIEVAESIPKQEQELARLKRNYSVDEGIYSHLLQRLEQARISKHLENSGEGTKFIVIEPARIPIKPVKPNKVKLAMVGLFFGLVIGTGTLVGAESFDHSIRTIDELRNFVDLPILGVTSKIITKDEEKKIKKRNKRAIIFIAGSFLFVILLLLILEILS